MKNNLLWFLIRLGITGLIFSGCLTLISMASTVANLSGVAGILVVLYYWLPSNEQWNNFKREIEDKIDED